MRKMAHILFNFIIIEESCHHLFGIGKILKIFGTENYTYV